LSFEIDGPFSPPLLCRLLSDVSFLAVDHDTRRSELPLSFFFILFLSSHCVMLSKGWLSDLLICLRFSVTRCCLAGFYLALHLFILIVFRHIYLLSSGRHRSFSRQDIQARAYLHFFSSCVWDQGYCIYYMDVAGKEGGRRKWHIY
jgi:hypothetical protein